MLFVHVNLPYEGTIHDYFRTIFFMRQYNCYFFNKFFSTMRIAEKIFFYNLFPNCNKY